MDQATFENDWAIRILSTVRDVTACKTAEARERLLTRKLNHRVNNLFDPALHDMATNAAIYCALSVPDGRREVKWLIEVRPDAAAAHRLDRELRAAQVATVAEAADQKMRTREPGITARP